jgi:hypothetical protein
MKQLSIAAILFLSVCTRSFAGDPVEKIPAFKGIENFKRTFPQASQIQCKNTNDLTEVSFIWQGLQLEVFYDKEGNTVATSRQLSEGNLPLNIQLNLKKQYPGYAVQQAIEFNDSDNSLSYYVTIACERLTYVLHVSTDGSCSVFKKMKN